MGAVLIAGALAAGCGDSPTQPTTVSYPPVLVCPGTVNAQSPLAQPVSVAYPEPSLTNGTAPVTVQCTPSSGANFPIGSTTVNCTATDASQRKATCSFMVTVTAPPRLGATRILAFGDSITAGEINSDSNGYSMRSVQLTLAYPEILRGQLTARYWGQTFARTDSLCYSYASAASANVVLINGGCPGQTALQDVGRFRSMLTIYSPDVVLLQEGVNDIDVGGTAGMSNAIASLQSMIREARGRGARVLVGTLLPERANALRALAPTLVAPFNSQLQSMARAEGAVVVDLYSDFLPGMATWIGSDGLHPTADGYAEMARVFYEAIKTNLESPVVVFPTTVSGSPMQIGPRAITRAR